MTHRAKVEPAAATKINWKESLARLEYGERLLVHGITQPQASNGVARYNNELRRFVTKADPRGVYVIRVK